MGSPTPRNPMRAEVAPVGSEIWWQRDTAGLSPDENPWEKFVEPYEAPDPLDPWRNYQAPPLFPEDWEVEIKPAVDSEDSQTTIPSTPFSLDEV